MFGIKYHRQVAVVAAFFILLTGCSRETTSKPPEAIPTREVTDDLGRTIKIPVKINRAISLAPNVTENVFAVGAGDKLVGVTTYCDYPAEAKEIKKIGDTITPNMEAIIALQPQIVLVSTASQMEAFTKTMEQNGIVVFVMDPVNLDGILKNLRQLGEIFGTVEKSEALVQGLRGRLDALRTKLNERGPIQVFVQISKEPLFTAGKPSFVTEIVEHAGAVSVTRDLPTPYPRISKETALAMNPEAIVVSAGAGNEDPNELFKDSTAVKGGKVFKVKADLLTRPSPRIVDGIEELARNLHPDSFK